MFPESNDSQTIVECLVRALKKVGAKLATQSFVTQITPLKKGFKLSINNEELYFDKLIVATGGSPKLSGMQWLSDLGYSIEKPVPSLFTFNMPSESIREDGRNSTKCKCKHREPNKNKVVHIDNALGNEWAAILKTSAFEARTLHQNYQFKTQIN